MSRCLLCDDAFASCPPGVKLIDFRYLHGFADGVRAARTAEGPLFCAEHARLSAEALAARGIAAVLPPKVH
jgi:hypothetical protein